MSNAADLLITGGRVFEAYRPSDLVPYGSDIGPRPIAAPNAIAIRDGPTRITWSLTETSSLVDPLRSSAPP